MGANILQDVEATGVQPTLFNLLKLSVLNPGFRTVALYRLSHWFYRYRLLKTFAWLIFNLNHLISGCEIKPSAEIGRGLHIPHATGIVVGERVVIGNWCTLYHNTSLGLARPGLPEYPVLGERVRIFVGASVFGAVRVGDGASIGAHALVLSDVPPGVIVVGAPARVVSRVKAET